MTELDDLFAEDLELETPVVESDLHIENKDDNIDDFFGLGSSNPIEETLLDNLLKAKGFTEGKVTLINDDETETQVNFYDLSKEEQLDILNSAEVSTGYDLNETETQFFDQLRTDGLTVEQFLQQYKDKILSETITEIAEPSYDIDAYSDQELFLLDLKNKYDLTDEELLLELEKELQNEELFNKKTAKLRVEYKQLEDNYKANQQQEFQNKKEEEYNQYANTIVDIAIKVPEFHGIVLEDDEKNETLSYLLELDDAGISKFYKDLKNPNKLYEAAWYMRYGKEAFEAIKDAYEGEIAKLKKVDKPRVVVQNVSKKTSIHDLI